VDVVCGSSISAAVALYMRLCVSSGLNPGRLNEHGLLQIKGKPKKLGNYGRVKIRVSGHTESCTF
jgi:hypothetical protein